MNQNDFRYPAMATAADVDKVISGAIDAAKTMKKKVQYAAIGCMILAGKEGKDADGVEYAELAVIKANYLVEQLGNGVKGEGLVKFMVYMCGFEVNVAVKKDGFIRTKGVEWIKANLEAAKEKAWYDYAPAAPYKGFDLEQQLANLLRMADNAVKIAEGDEAKAKQVTVDRDMLDVLHALVGGKPVVAQHALRLVEKLIPDNTVVSNDKVTDNKGEAIDLDTAEPLADAG